MTTYQSMDLIYENFIFDINKQNRKLIDELFFPYDHRNVIKRGSCDYDGFWDFLSRMQKNILLKFSNGNKNAAFFDPRAKMLMSTVNFLLEDHIRHMPEVNIKPSSLSANNLKCVHMIFDMYLDFLQKQKLQKIEKIRKDRGNLPIASFKNDILSKLKENQVILIAGDTGCGKSTQVPQFLNEGFSFEDRFKKIAVTQPRRIACMSLSERVKCESLSQQSSKVGHMIRFEKSATKFTEIVFLTEGLLLRQIQSDPMLSCYDVVVLDEVHERHWQTDCLLGLIKCLTYARPEIRVVLMSATINTELFSSFFNNCPIIQVPGRLHPIQLKYLPLTESEQESSRINPSPYLRLLQHIDQTYPATERGDLLVFLAGMSDIQVILSSVRVYAEHSKRWIILPLHSALSVEEQDKIFHSTPETIRKCILSTNIAETSVTIDGIRFVADSGKMKEISWDNSARMRRLKEFSISQASADQRKGRAGRTGPGVCFRLYDESDYLKWPKFNTPEIHRVPLESIILQMMAMGLPDVRKFPFIQIPEEKSLDEALNSLINHGAVKITSQNKFDSMAQDQSVDSSKLVISSLGRLLADLPVDLSIGRMLVIASMFGAVEKVLTLAASLSVQNPFSMKITGSTSAKARVKIAERMQEFESYHGVPFTITALFDEWLKIKSKYAQKCNIDRITGRKYHKKRKFYSESDNDDDEALDPKVWCQRLGIEEQRFHEIVRIRAQFADLLKNSGLLPTSSFSHSESNLDQETLRKQRKLINYAKRQEQAGSGKKRVLTLQDNYDNNDSEENSNSDCETKTKAAVNRLKKWNKSTATNNDSLMSKDLELLLCYKIDDLATYLDEQRQLFTKGDLLLLKVVIAGGLYPHLAVGDPANSYRVSHKGSVHGPGAEMVFHTPTINFVMLQPNDIFTRNPDVLFSEESDKPLDIDDVSKTEEARIKVQKSYASHAASKRVPFARDHQLLVYSDLIETTKQFMLNPIRVPLLPILLLYSRVIDTNYDTTRIVFDKWIQVDLVDSIMSQKALACVIWLRVNLEKLMKLKLNKALSTKSEDVDSGLASSTNIFMESKVNDASKLTQQKKLQKLLSLSLASFLAAGPGGVHSYSKLQAADVKKLYRDCKTKIPPRDSGLLISKETGGYKINDFLTINNLFIPKSKSQSEELEDFMHDKEAIDLSIRFYSQIQNVKMTGTNTKMTNL